MNYNWVKINDRSNYVFPVKVIHPDHPKYGVYWKEEKKRIIEGYWAWDYNHYRFMPPKLYYTVNHGTLLLTDHENKRRTLERPLLTTLFWEFAYMSLESLGFSGFKDSDITCNKNIHRLAKNWSSINSERHKHMFNSNGQFKEYADPREFMRMQHSKNLGVPLYENEPKNYMILGTRGK